jgi:hypothetical protein
VVSFSLLTTITLWFLISIGRRHLQYTECHAQLLVHLSPFTKHDTSPRCRLGVFLVLFVLQTLLTKEMHNSDGLTKLISSDTVNSIVDAYQFK